jgi:nickel-dependent lactate racemase
MVEFWLPYGWSEVPVRVPEERLLDVIRPSKASVLSSQLDEIRSALQRDENLLEATKKANRICLALGPCANKELAVQLISAFYETIRPRTHDHLTILRTKDAVELEPSAFPEAEVLDHDPLTASTLPVQGFTGSFPVEINANFLEADLRLAVGELKPHPFLQYAGLCDLVFPGLASAASLRGHISNRTGFTSSNLRQERNAIMNLLDNIFAMGVVLDADKMPLKTAFGNLPELVSTLGESLQELLTANILKLADIVVMSVGGAPQDASLLQATDAFPTGISALKKNGILITAAECRHGHGDTEFYDWSAEKKEAHHLEARLRHHFNYDGFKAAFLRRSLSSHRLYLVSTIPDHYVENIFGMKPAPTVNAALQSAQRILGSDSGISVIPDASRVIIHQQVREQARPNADSR